MPDAERKEYASFTEFYPFYLGEHANRTSRRLHFAGTTLSLLCLVRGALELDAWWILAALVCGYGFAWTGHFFFEKNRPATFTYPVYSLMGDWVMWGEVLRGKIKL